MLTKIQSYEIIEKIGVGGMGIVYKAQNTRLEKIVAIKALTPQFLHNESIKARFITEAKIMSKLDHPNIVKVIDLLEDETGIYIVMEYIEGKTLDKVIGKEIGPIPYERALPLFNQILSAISYAHQAGIIHRDIKPSNIMLTNDGNIKVMDFGIAKVKEGTQHTKTGTKLGTLYYMSPEQIRGEKVDERSDIYSLGMTLYEMLAGRLPFKNVDTTSEFEIMNKIVYENIPDPREFYPAIPEWLVSVLQKMLSKDKTNRFSSCEEIKKVLKNEEVVYIPKIIKNIPPEEKTEQVETPKMFLKPFSFKGRIRRLEYGLSIIIFVIAKAIITAIFPAAIVIAVWFLWAQGAKRCHDLGKSGWWQIVPFYGLWMLFQDGKPYENEYGPNPKGIDFFKLQEENT